MTSRPTTDNRVQLNGKITDTALASTLNQMGVNVAYPDVSKLKINILKFQDDSDSSQD